MDYSAHKLKMEQHDGTSVMILNNQGSIDQDSLYLDPLCNIKGALPNSSVEQKLIRNSLQKLTMIDKPEDIASSENDPDPQN